MPRRAAIDQTAEVADSQSSGNRDECRLTAEMSTLRRGVRSGVTSDND